MVYFAEMPSPVGTLLLLADEENLTGIWMDRKPPVEALEQPDQPVLRSTAQWLEDYFHGKPAEVGFPLNPSGTSFQQQVWKILLTIPFGETRTYGDIAREMACLMGKEKMSAQAVGQAVGRNPISILIPCHRVVGAGGKLTGYASGLEKKQWLLRHEGWLAAGNRSEG